MKYAVIKTGGKQHLVTEGDTISIEKIPSKPKDKIVFDKVLLTVDGDKITLGQPLIKTAKVSALVIDQLKDKKIRVAKFRAKSRYRKVQGHRQRFTKVKIIKI